MDELSDSYLGLVAEAFIHSAHTIKCTLSEGRVHTDPFVRRFYPVLRHYRPEIVGQCLALSYDDPELGRRSQLHGFGMDMKAGFHPDDWESRLGSYRDDGSYLALQAHDYFTGSLR